MEKFVVTFTAKPGTEDKVSDFYLRQQPEYEKAKGFRDRKIYRAKVGTMVEAVKKMYSEEERANHPEKHHEGDPAVHFVIVETWDSVDDRMTFSKNRDKTLDRELFPMLEPQHSHEFYEEITPA